MLGKKLSAKSAKNVFLYSHKYRYKIWGEKKRETIFQKHKNSGIKKCREKNRRKKVRKRFFIFTQISLQNMGEKRAKQFLRNTRIVR